MTKLSTVFLLKEDKTVEVGRYEDGGTAEFTLSFTDKEIDKIIELLENFETREHGLKSWLLANFRHIKDGSVNRTSAAIASKLLMQALKNLDPWQWAEFDKNLLVKLLKIINILYVYKP